MPVYSISEYLKRARRAIESMNDVRIIDAIMIDGRDYSIDDQGNIRIPRICIISGSGIELRSIKKIKMLSEIKEHFNKMITQGLYPIIKLKVLGNIVTDVELNNKGIKIEDAARKVISIAKHQKKYAVFWGENIFYWRDKQAVIENDNKNVYLPSRLLVPMALAQEEEAIRSEFNELISQAIEVKNNEGQQAT